MSGRCSIISKLRARSAADAGRRWLRQKPGGYKEADYPYKMVPEKYEPVAVASGTHSPASAAQ